MKTTIRKWVRPVLIACAALALVIQLIPGGYSHSNPPVLAEPQWNSTRTQALFDRTCADCHSNRTVWPWYSSIAPVSWLTEWDVQEGREEVKLPAAIAQQSKHLHASTCGASSTARRLVAKATRTDWKPAR